MRLRSFRVRAFRCVRDSGPVSVGDLAVVIGKNESGKTAILRALAHLNKDSQFRQVDLCDEMYEELSRGLRVVEGDFEMSEGEVATVREKFPDCPEFKNVRIFRTNLPDEIDYDFPDVKEFPVHYRLVEKGVPDFTVAVSKFKEIAEAIKGKSTTNEADSWSAQFSGLASYLDDLTKLDKSQLFDKVAALKAALGPVLTEQSELSGAFIKLEQTQRKLFKEISLREELTDFIGEKLHPRFVYFADYKKILGKINIPNYLANVDSKQIEAGDLDAKETIENLFYLANLDAKTLDKIKAIPDERVKYLSECGARLSKALEPTWLTQKIEVEFEFSENLLIVKVSDLHGDGTRTNKGLLRRRSEGFRWHFSFFVNFTAEVQKAELREAILLLDEPGLHLHPAQQVGMLNILRQLATKNQVLYTTHSPFMILDYDVGSLLTVELDPTTHLSRIQPAYWKGDPETTLLVLHALGGHTLADAWTKSLAAVAAPSLIVEGPTDYMYLRVLLDVVRKRRGKNVAEFPFTSELVPAHGSSAIAPFAMFHIEKGFRVAVLYDNEPQARKYSEGLVAQGFDQTRIFFAEVTGKTESDIEDFFSDTEYLRAVNLVYSEVLKDARYFPVEKKHLNAAREKQRAVTRIVPLLQLTWGEYENWGTFDKTLVCKKICELAVADESFLADKTIERFQNLFERVQAGILPQVDINKVPASAEAAASEEGQTSTKRKKA